MAKNIDQQKDANIQRAVPVPAGTKSGDVVLLGTDGLKALALTDRATTALIVSGASAPGLADGQATVRLAGIATVVLLTVANAVAQFAPVYKVAADGTYSATAAGGTRIGYALLPLTAAGIAPVALSG